MKGDYMKVKINNMNWKKLGKILGVSIVLVLSGCNEAEEKETEFSLYGTEEVAEDVSLVYDHLDVKKEPNKYWMFQEKNLNWLWNTLST